MTEDEQHEAETLRHLKAIEGRSKPKQTLEELLREIEEHCGPAPY